MLGIKYGEEIANDRKGQRGVVITAMVLYSKRKRGVIKHTYLKNNIYGYVINV